MPDFIKHLALLFSRQRLQIEERLTLQGVSLSIADHAERRIATFVRQYRSEYPTADTASARIKGRPQVILVMDQPLAVQRARRRAEAVRGNPSD
jgi:hypothetical protein